MKYQIEFTDSRTGATSPIDTVIAPAGYTAEDYIRDCDKNADSDWCEMLHRGEVSLENVTEYRIRPEYITLWGEDCDENTVITQEELERLAAEWEKPVDELMEQLDEI